MTAQMPAANARVAAGSEIVLYCGEEPDTEPVTVPDLLGLSYEVARVRAGMYGLYVRGEGTMMESDYILTVDQSVEEGQLVAPGTVITVTLSDWTKTGIF